MIPAIPHILKEFPDTIFLWVGDGPQRDHLQQRLEEYGVASHVTLTGYRQDVSALLHAADLFVFPTHFEGLPFAVLEAMACGAPIVSSRAASLPEIIEHGTHGLLFCTGDSCDLLETLRWSLRHPEQMQTMAQNALLRVQDFDQQRLPRNAIPRRRCCAGRTDSRSFPRRWWCVNDTCGHSLRRAAGL